MHSYCTDTWRVDDQMGNHHLSCKIDVQNDNMAEEKKKFTKIRSQNRLEAWILFHMIEINTCKSNSKGKGVLKNCFFSDQFDSAASYKP